MRSSTLAVTVRQGCGQSSQAKRADGRCRIAPPPTKKKKNPQGRSLGVHTHALSLCNIPTAEGHTENTCKVSNSTQSPGSAASSSMFFGSNLGINASTRPTACNAPGKLTSSRRSSHSEPKVAVVRQAVQKKRQTIRTALCSLDQRKESQCDAAAVTSGRGIRGASRGNAMWCSARRNTDMTTAHGHSFMHPHLHARAHIPAFRKNPGWELQCHPYPMLFVALLKQRVEDRRLTGMSVFKS